MKSVDFIFVGQAREGSYKKLEESYLERVGHYVRTAKIHFVKDSPHKNTTARKEKETESILNLIEPKDVVVVCDEFGKSVTSVQFASKIESWTGMGPRLIFVVGGAYGMSEPVMQRGLFRLKLSEWTLPHELARVVLLEQVYRAFTILKGEKYHH